MRRPQVLTPAWCAVLVVVLLLGGVVAEWIDVALFADQDETFQWSDVVVFAGVMLVLNVGLNLRNRRRQRAHGLG